MLLLNFRYILHNLMHKHDNMQIPQGDVFVHVCRQQQIGGWGDGGCYQIYSDLN